MKDIPVVWLQGAGCTGCSVSLMNAQYPRIRNLLLDEVVPGVHISLKFHPTIMGGSGEIALEVLKAEKLGRDYLLVVEGSIPEGNNGIYCVVGEEKDRPVTLRERFLSLASRSLGIIALGDCAAFGGIPSAEPNPTGASSVEEVLRKENLSIPYLNVPGCPPHPDWFLTPVVRIILGGWPSAEELDELHRLKSLHGKTIHENCPRRPYFEEGKFAQNFNEEGCLYILGCKGPFTYSDCPLRKWNSGVNWVIGAGSPCLACTEPEFPELSTPFYEKFDWEKVKIKIRGGKIEENPDRSGNPD